jgi:hypothetical protein
MIILMRLPPVIPPSIGLETLCPCKQGCKGCWASSGDPQGCPVARVYPVAHSGKRDFRAARSLDSPCMTQGDATGSAAAMVMDREAGGCFMPL